MQWRLAEIQEKVRSVWWSSLVYDIINLLLLVLSSRRSRQRERLHAIGVSICSSVRLSVAKLQKRDFLKKTKQFRAMVSIDDL